MAIPTLKLDNIQGNSVGGFNKDFMSLLFLKFKTAAKGRSWIAEIVDADLGVAASSSQQVLRFNAQFKALRAAGIQPETVIEAAWTSLALSHRGLKALGVNTADLTRFPTPFKQGMAARKSIIGDLGSSDPSQWSAPFQDPAEVHAVLLVAADREPALTERVRAITATPKFQAGAAIVGLPVQGRTRVDERGHEHFGFKDGVSQPGIRGITPADDPVGNPDQGQPGQDLLWPGEFVLGYPKQIGQAPAADSGDVNTNPGPISKSGPKWTVDGSYLVFRRLEQDVPGFRAHLKALAQQNNLSQDLMGAKLVGRYKSGCPIETRSFEQPHDPSSVDPGIANPALADNDTLNNNFEFGDDAEGGRCPLAAHIRKAYPRNERTLKKANDSESDTQTHRLLRRGIPFGVSFGAGAGGGAGDPRGLLFMCYQTDLERQFEFVQSQWVNNAAFPTFPVGHLPPGEDPIIAQSPQGSFVLDPNSPAIQVKHFVTTTGGEYFLAPSIDALRRLGAGELS